MNKENWYRIVLPEGRLLQRSEIAVGHFKDEDGRRTGGRAALEGESRSQNASLPPSFLPSPHAAFVRAQSAGTVLCWCMHSHFTFNSARRLLPWCHLRAFSRYQTLHPLPQMESSGATWSWASVPVRKRPLEFESGDDGRIAPSGGRCRQWSAWLMGGWWGGGSPGQVRTAGTVSVVLPASQSPLLEPKQLEEKGGTPVRSLS